MDTHDFHRQPKKYGNRTRISSFSCRTRPSVKIVGFSGFTLIELIVTLVIAGILSSIAAPAFVAFVKNNRLTSQANDLMADLAFARSEGIKRGTQMVVCKTADPNAAPPTCSVGAAWQNGWIIGVDANLNTTLDAGELIIRVHEKLTGQANTLAGIGGGTTPLDDQLVYTGSGLAALNAAGSFSVCDDRGPTRGRSIQISVTGRPHISDTSPASCT